MIHAPAKKRSGGPPPRPTPKSVAKSPSRRKTGKTKVSGESVILNIARGSVDGTGKDQAASKNNWLDVPEATCVSCKQGTHSSDRDNLAGSKCLVRWVHKAVNVAGDVYPSGRECYPCFDVRRTHFTEGENPVSIDRCLEVRKDDATDETNPRKATCQSAG